MSAQLIVLPQDCSFLVALPQSFYFFSPLPQPYGFLGPTLQSPFRALPTGILRQFPLSHNTKPILKKTRMRFYELPWSWPYPPEVS